MRFIISATLILAVIAAVTYGEAQHYQYPNNPYLFPGYPLMSTRNQPDNRFFFSGLFTTFTYTISTVTSTTVATTVTTCTTSATTLTTCTAGRKRRDAHGVFRNPRGLLYEEKEEEEEQNIFLPTQDKASAESDAGRSPRQMEVQPAIPFNAIQPTFGAYYTPEMGYNNNISPAVPLSRIFLAFGTATVTVTSTSTSTSKLTAACSSTTSFSTCTS